MAEASHVIESAGMVTSEGQVIRGLKFDVPLPHNRFCCEYVIKKHSNPTRNRDGCAMFAEEEEMLERM